MSRKKKWNVRNDSNDSQLSWTNLRRNSGPMKSLELDRQKCNSSASYFLACRVSSQFNGRNIAYNFLLPAPLLPARYSFLPVLSLDRVFSLFLRASAKNSKMQRIHGRVSKLVRV